MHVAETHGWQVAWPTTGVERFLLVALILVVVFTTIVLLVAVVQIVYDWFPEWLQRRQEAQEERRIEWLRAFLKHRLGESDEEGRPR